MAKNEVLTKCTSPVEGDVIPGLILGVLDRKYRGYELVSCTIPPNLFGTKSKRARRLICTLKNGLINQCSIRGNVPTPYFAVLQAAIDLKQGFKRQDIINMAVRIVGEGKRKACELSWDVLRNHHRHARKCEAGMVFMIQEDNKEKGKLMIRARDISESVQYFKAQPGRRKEARAIVAAQVAEVAGG